MYTRTRDRTDEARPSMRRVDGGAGGVQAGTLLQVLKVSDGQKQRRRDANVVPLSPADPRQPLDDGSGRLRASPEGLPYFRGRLLLNGGSRGPRGSVVLTGGFASLTDLTGGAQAGSALTDLTPITRNPLEPGAACPWELGRGTGTWEEPSSKRNHVIGESFRGRSSKLGDGAASRPSAARTSAGLIHAGLCRSEDISHSPGAQKTYQQCSPTLLPRSPCSLALASAQPG
eukprot:6727105-Prymnesium_polylepis.1